MSSDPVPYRSEVMGWSPQQLADFMKRMNLSGCDKAVLKHSISGSRFVNMSDNDLQKFPKPYSPMIMKLSSEISKKEEKRGLFAKKTTPRYHEPDTVDVQGWGEDEFDDDDDDYEKPNSSDGDYESPSEDLDGDYEPPPSEPQEDLAHNLCPSLPIGDGEYIDKWDNHVSSRGTAPPAVCPRPPVSTLTPPSPRVAGDSSTRRDSSPHVGAQVSGKFPPAPPQIFRDIKPGRSSGYSSTAVRGPQFSTVDRAGRAPTWKPQSENKDTPTWTKPPVLPPPSATVSRSNSSVRPPPPDRFDQRREQIPPEASKNNTFPLQNKGLPPRPGLPGLPSHQGHSLPPSQCRLPAGYTEQSGSFTGSERNSFRPQQATSKSKELDPRWYVGKVTRGQAEGSLRRVHKDGAYLVRDSTRQLDNQPFTLMVFYQDKVYNIQIRQQKQQFLLGTGLKVQEFFPSVSDIISHYSQSPLLLINAKDRGSSQQNQCLLSEPAGFHLTGQNWS
ncbi:lymphocyte cytosolic protein 2a [Solea solea]|uniref:lymphocyte cytosolic protein 2a n=1 Tax=Solea solea TaxID=90069 RepID=UPI00272B80EA|nr:lymphocyte cytosolic protein 2a [Solea solea]